MRVWVSVICDTDHLSIHQLGDEEESFLCDNQLVIPPVVAKKKTHFVHEEVVRVHLQVRGATPGKKAKETNL